MEQEIVSKKLVVPIGKDTKNPDSLPEKHGYF